MGGQQSLQRLKNPNLTCNAYSSIFYAFHEACLKNFQGTTKDPSLKFLKHLEGFDFYDWTGTSQQDAGNACPNSPREMRVLTRTRRRLISTPVPHGPRASPQLVLSTSQPESDISL